MNTSTPPATTPIHPHHPSHNHIPAGYNIAIPYRAFINNSDDARNPPSEPYRDLLIEAGCEVMVHDPHVLEYPDVEISRDLDDVVKGADVVAVLTGHNEYFGLDAKMLKRLMGQERPVIVDGRNVVDADGFVGAGFVYMGIGRGIGIVTLCAKNGGEVDNNMKIVSIVGARPQFIKCVPLRFAY